MASLIDLKKRQGKECSQLMKKRAMILSLLFAAMLFGSCSSLDNGGLLEETTDEIIYDGRVYTHEERLALIDDAVLKLPGSFYDQDIKDEYFRCLRIIEREYLEPGVVEDVEFWNFEQAKAALNASYRSDYPVIVLKLPDGLWKEYREGYVTVIDNGEIIESDIMVKVRGNSTASADKKPYNIKFSTKTSLFGMEEGKKWSLIANMFDKTMMRNKLALDFASKLRLDYVSQTTFCEVWVNGKYRGNYLCCEPVSDGKNRVAVNTDEYDFILEVSPSGGWDFETDEGVKLIYDSPDDPTEDQKKHLKSFLKKAEKAMKSGDEAEYSKYIDVDSFVDLYIMMELFKDVDGYWKSLYFYVKDDILYAGPPWDFDLSCGNVSSTFVQENYFNYHNTNDHGDNSGDSTHGFRMVHGWWRILLETEHFSELVRERYKELQPLIVNLYKDNSEGENQIDLLLEANRSSFDREYIQNKDTTDYNAGWDVYACYSIYAAESEGDYDANVKFLREWLEARNEWLLENIGR